MNLSVISGMIDIRKKFAFFPTRFGCFQDAIWHHNIVVRKKRGVAAEKHASVDYLLEI